MTTQVNYYVFDRIEEDGSEYRGYKGDDSCEVFPLSSQDTEADLIEAGHAKCDAPGTETFVVFESDWEALQERIAA